MKSPLPSASHPSAGNFAGSLPPAFFFAAHTRHKTATAHFGGKYTRKDFLMTYANRSLVKDVVIKVRISEKDDERLDQLQRETGEQKAALARQLLLAQLEIALKAEQTKAT